VRPPPLHRPHVEHPHKPASPKGRARRVLAQCDECKAAASATARGRRIVWTELPTDSDLRHLGCGGRIVGFDIAESAS
jgi:hypothetical protein